MPRSYHIDVADLKLSDIPIAVMGMVEANTISSIHCHQLGRTTNYPRLDKALVEHKTQGQEIKAIAVSLIDNTS